MQLPDPVGPTLEQQPVFRRPCFTAHVSPPVFHCPCFTAHVSLLVFHSPPKAARIPREKGRDCWNCCVSSARDKEGKKYHRNGWWREPNPGIDAITRNKKSRATGCVLSTQVLLGFPHHPQPPISSPGCCHLQT